MTAGQASSWPIFLNAGIAGILLGFGVPVTGIAAWTLLIEANDTIGGALALALLPFSLAATALGLMWTYGVWGWVRARGQEFGKPLLIKGLAFLGVGIAGPVGFLVLLAGRAS